MNSIKTLFVEIDRPGLEEPLRLMSGHGFSVLRTDNTGRDIYGCAHEGKEYLLFPLSFEQSSRDRLDMSIPASYEEWFMDMVADGAVIRFTTPWGEHVFVGMPEEYQSGSGILRIDGSGGVSVTMDKADPSRRAVARDCEKPHRPEDGAKPHVHDSACSCHGHEHAGHEHCHEHHHGQAPHRHGTGVRVQVSMSDPELADAIRKRTEGLNLLLQQAAAAGLEVNISLTVNRGSDNTPDCPQMSVVKIARSL